MKRLVYAAIAVITMALATVIANPQQLIAQQPTPGAIVKQDRSNCDSAYPDVCIAVYPPDLNCGDISQRRFRAYLPTDGDAPEELTRFDPHGFDRDKDGVGCES